MTMYDVEIVRDLVFAEIGGKSLAADLYRPATSAPPPVVLYIHGGGWAVGSRSDGAESRLRPLAAEGVAVLSIDYRLVDTARFPAQIHDVKGAIRWVRREAGTLKVDASRVGVWGASAGALLASLAGVTNGQDAFNGDVGGHAGISSDADAVVAWFGQSDMLASTHRSWLEKEILPFNFEAGLLGLGSSAEVGASPDLARQASPIAWVSAKAPPFLIAHGDRDRVVPISESEALHGALVRAGARSHLLVVGGAGHEDAAFDSPANLALTAGFLRAALKG